jgi:hypothetical protein
VPARHHLHLRLRPRVRARRVINRALTSQRPRRRLDLRGRHPMSLTPSVRITRPQPRSRYARERRIPRDRTSDAVVRSPMSLRRVRRTADLGGQVTFSAASCSRRRSTLPTEATPKESESDKCRNAARWTGEHNEMWRRGIITVIAAGLLSACGEEKQNPETHEGWEVGDCVTFEEGRPDTRHFPSRRAFDDRRRPAPAIVVSPLTNARTASTTCTT